MPIPDFTCNVPISALRFPFGRPLNQKLWDWLKKNLVEDGLVHEAHLIPALIPAEELTALQEAHTDYVGGQ